MKRRFIEIPATAKPTVELDSEAHAAYVRFSTKGVARTEEIEVSPVTITVDFDADNNVVGVELVGVAEFGISELAKQARIRMSPDMERQVRYVPVPVPA